MMDKEIKQMWVDALRSGKYEQTYGMLKSAGARYCCLGVLAKECGILNPDGTINRPLDPDQDYPVTSYSRHGGDLPLIVQDEIGLVDTKVLIEMNDNQTKSFAEIADYIEANL